MTNFTFMESSSNHSYLDFSNPVASRTSFLGGASQSSDTINPYLASLTHGPFESTDSLRPRMHPLETTKMPPSALVSSVEEVACLTFGENHKNNLQIKGGINKGWLEKVGVRRPWTEGEDTLLKGLVVQFGAKNWARIAAKLPLRVAKQCRDRWQNRLRPDIMKNDWSEEDDKLLIALHKQYGNKWADIAKHMPGRSDNCIKNHWNGTKRKKLPEGRKKAKHFPFLLKDYITSVCSSDHQTIIQTGCLEQAESSACDTQNHQPVMNLNGHPSSSLGSGLDNKPHELVIHDFNEVTSYFLEEIESDQTGDTEFVDTSQLQGIMDMLLSCL